MRFYLNVFAFFIISANSAFAEVSEDELMFIDGPYAVTHLSDLDVDCVWAKDAKGNITSEAFGQKGSGVCWSQKAADQVNSLDKDGKLIWRNHHKADKKVEFGGYTANRNNISGSVLLACYTGSLDSDGAMVSRGEQINRYEALQGLYEGDVKSRSRIIGAFNFARNNLSDKYPLDVRGQYRASVCDEMVRLGKL